jgi:hypothetical protein
VRWEIDRFVQAFGTRCQTLRWLLVAIVVPKVRALRGDLRVLPEDRI